MILLPSLLPGSRRATGVDKHARSEREREERRRHRYRYRQRQSDRATTERER
jgi:hypothetical protein